MFYGIDAFSLELPAHPTTYQSEPEAAATAVGLYG